ncbi:HD domain-containing protein [Candidatus Woesearchaeota archaeon]|nr:HD domain-containing protein [Candidatus Woesearchaeota archaeon]
MNHQSILNFMFELGMLKRVKREGWRRLGIEHPESVADHSLRAAQLGYILAHLEKYHDPREVAVLVLFHDIGECRIGDLHKIAQQYVDAREEQVVKDQTANMGKIGADILSLWKNHHSSSPAGKLAHDADLLECAISAKEYIELGYKDAQSWIKVIAHHITTPSAQQLLKELEHADVHAWWKEIRLPAEKNQKNRRA